MVTNQYPQLTSHQTTTNSIYIAPEPSSQLKNHLHNKTTTFSFILWVNMVVFEQIWWCFAISDTANWKLYKSMKNKNNYNHNTTATATATTTTPVTTDTTSSTTQKSYPQLTKWHKSVSAAYKTMSIFHSSQNHIHSSQNHYQQLTMTQSIYTAHKLNIKGQFFQFCFMIYFMVKYDEFWSDLMMFHHIWHSKVKVIKLCKKIEIM